jgi:hypothetical protein
VGWGGPRRRWRLLACLIALAPAVTAAHGRDRTPWMGRPATERKHFQGDQFLRAGCPQCISPLAKPTESSHEIGYYVGGGARERSRRGECRLPHEGIWGTDYAGLLIHKHVELGWAHGRNASGTGTYSPDGPRVVHRP